MLTNKHTAWEHAAVAPQQRNTLAMKRNAEHTHTQTVGSCPILIQVKALKTYAQRMQALSLVDKWSQACISSSKQVTDGMMICAD